MARGVALDPTVVARLPLELAELPEVTKGTAMALMIAGLLSVTFMGFGGLGG